MIETTPEISVSELMERVGAKVEESRRVQRHSKLPLAAAVKEFAAAIMPKPVTPKTQQILQAAQIHDVDVVQTDGFLGDHYDPTTKKLCLSSTVYNTPSVAALGIAAHETGHAIQIGRAHV